MDARSTRSVGVGINSSGYHLRSWDHQFDLIFKKDFWGLKNKLLVGGTFREAMQQYNAQAFIYYALIPGANNATGNPASRIIREVTVHHGVNARVPPGRLPAG